MVDFDVVIPDKNEEEFIEQAKVLGYKEIVFLTDNMNYIKPSTDKLLIRTAYLIKDVSEISRARKKFDYLFANAERKYFELKVDFILDLESINHRDSFHYKITNLNQVHAELAKKNNLTMVFDFNGLISNPVLAKGKMFQNALLIKKYKLKYSTFSLATEPHMMRSSNILRSLEIILGL
jgi:RNase P/RNase MRP subunit p30